MRKIVRMIAVALLAAPCCQGEGWYATWERSGNTWQEKWKNSLDKADQLSMPERMELLGEAVKITGSNGGPNEEQKEIIDRARAALLAIPDHAEYYRDRIIEERAKMDAFDPEVNSVMWNYQRTQWKKARGGISVMGQLPSVGSVKVLGDFLSDDRDLVPLPPGASTQQRETWEESWPLSYFAVFAISRLPIVSKPYARQIGDRGFRPAELEDALKAWRQWYEEIKSGKRTFRFEGDPTEYDLNGPASAEKVGHITRDRKRDEERTAGQHKSTPAPPEMVARAIRIPGPGILAVMVAAGLLAAAGVTRWARGRW